MDSRPECTFYPLLKFLELILAWYRKNVLRIPHIRYTLYSWYQPGCRLLIDKYIFPLPLFEAEMSRESVYQILHYPKKNSWPKEISLNQTETLPETIINS